MSRDPYNEVKRDVENNLSHTKDLLQSYSRISSSGTHSHDVEETRHELRSTLEALEADLEDLDESVRAVEGAGSRWGMDVTEINRRRGFVERVKKEVKDLRQKVVGSKGKGKGKSNEQDGGRYRDLPEEEDRIGDDPDETRRWEQEEQQMYVKRQDDTLGVISGTLSTLVSQAGLIGQEVGEQSEMLDDLDTRVDHTDSKLRRATRQLNDFIRKNETTRSNWCIGILIVVLIILLLLVILT